MNGGRDPKLAYVSGNSKPFGSGYSEPTDGNKNRNYATYDNHQPLKQTCKQEPPSNRPYSMQDLRPGSSILGDLGFNPSSTVY